MFKTFINSLKIKDIRTKLLFTFVCLIIVRLGCMLPVPGINREYYSAWVSSLEGLDFLRALTGGSFEQMSIFALNISPYITSSIIMQLLTVAIPKLEEMQKDGDTGRKKIAEITRYVTIGLAVFESIAMVIGFNNSNLLTSDLNFAGNLIVITASFTAGSAFLMWLGEQITEKGIGNGISVILLINIVSTLPTSYSSLFNTFIMEPEKVVSKILGGVVIVVATVGIILLILLLEGSERRISVQYAKKVQGRKTVGGQATYIPLKVNTAGVIPVIFSSSLMQTPVIISSLLGVSASRTGSVWQKILYLLSQDKWFHFTKEEVIYTLGVLIYIALNVFFAYFYTEITFNPMEVANNLKKQGGFIPGIRPGRPTTDYLSKVLHNIIFIGATGLTIVALIPIILSGAFNASLGFGGTSIIIVVGVVLEMMRQVETMMRERHYKGFLSDD
ncbi:MAG: preprotein translocase subunit SecY [Lachnospiraceae bacterium]|nr:preprotein translocase subunit SecY [Lachnospiraceae bacterium]